MATPNPNPNSNPNLNPVSSVSGSNAAKAEASASLAAKVDTDAATAATIQAVLEEELALAEAAKTGSSMVPPSNARPGSSGSSSTGNSNPRPGANSSASSTASSSLGPSSLSGLDRKAAVEADEALARRLQKEDDDAGMQSLPAFQGSKSGAAGWHAPTLVPFQPSCSLDRITVALTGETTTVECPPLNAGGSDPNPRMLHGYAAAQDRKKEEELKSKKEAMIKAAGEVVAKHFGGANDDLQKQIVNDYFNNPKFIDSWGLEIFEALQAIEKRIDKDFQPSIGKLSPPKSVNSAGK